MVASLPHIFPPDEYPFPYEPILQRWQDELVDPAFEILVHRKDGKIVGYVASHDEWLNHVATLPSEWGTGLATWLTKASVESRRTLGHDVVHLWVLKENHRARRFYDRSGWEPSGVVVNEPFPPHPEKLEYVLPGKLTFDRPGEPDGPAL